MQHQHESTHTTYDIMVNLKVKFGDQDRDDRQDGINVFLNTKMTKDPKSSYRWGNLDRYSAHKIAKSSSSFFALATLRVEDFVSLAEFLKGL